MQESFEFSGKFRNWVIEIFKSTIIFILHNGSPFGFVHCSKAVRQGDLLSLLYFRIVEDFQSRFRLKLCDLFTLQLLHGTFHSFFDKKNKNLTTMKELIDNLLDY